MSVLCLLLENRSDTHAQTEVEALQVQQQDVHSPGIGHMTHAVSTSYVAT